MCWARRFWAALTVVGVVAAGAACDDGEGVASLGEDTAVTTGDLIAEQARGAEDLVNCLAGVGIEANLDPWGDGQFYVQPVFDEVYLLGWGGTSPGLPDGLTDSIVELASKDDPMIASQYDPIRFPQEEPWNQASPSEEDIVAALSEIPPYLIVGQQDRTAEWAQCLESSGYADPVNYPDPDQEVANKQAYLQPTLDWIACAREHGYPEIEDPFPVKADEYQTDPTAVLPIDMTGDQLRALLEVCPNFDQAAYDAWQADLLALGTDYTAEQYEEVMGRYPVGPNIGLDAPGLDGDHRPGVETDAPESANAMVLFEILREKREAWEAANPNPYCC